jgi:predicted ATP-grasp superfamily ATP-dependent carboligase
MVGIAIKRHINLMSSKLKSDIKILVFEFVTGGGMIQQKLPESLAKEGGLMLKALIEELAMLPSVQITMLLDWRCQQMDLPGGIEVIMLSTGQCVYDLLPALIEKTDLVWPIVPELDGELHKFSTLVEAKAKQLLNSSVEAVRICSDKLITAQLLKKHGIAVVETSLFDRFSADLFEPCVVKPKDGVGCINCFLISNTNEFEQINNLIKNKSDYIIQPYIEGETISLSCLFKNGKAWLLSCNQQQISISKGQFELDACVVNIPSNNMEIYRGIIDQIAKVIPGLWGYVGIDVIHAENNQPLIVEINPRLTTSYVGLYQALGVNVVQNVMEMIHGEPQINRTNNQPITV